MTPLLPVCVSLHVPVARIADMPPRIPMHATSKRIGSETFSLQKKNAKKKKNTEKISEAEIRRANNPGYMPLIQNESEDGKKSTNAGKAAEKSKDKIDEDACSKIRRCCSLSWSFEPCDAAQFSSLEVTRSFRSLYHSGIFFLLLLLLFSVSAIRSVLTLERKHLTGEKSWKFDFEASKEEKKLLCTIVL